MTSNLDFKLIMIIFFLLLFLTTVLIFIFIRVLKRGSASGRSLGRRLLSIRISKDDKKDKEIDFKTEIGKSEQLFNSLSSLEGGVVLEAAVRHIGEEIHFYIAVNAKAVDFVSRQIQGLWPGAEIKETSDYTIFNPDGLAVGGYLAFKQNSFLPLRSYIEAGLDTFAPILSGLSTLNEIGEGAALQIIIKPAPNFFKKQLAGAMERLKKGDSIEAVLSAKAAIWNDLKKTFESSRQEPAGKQPIVNEEAVSAIQRKTSKPLLEANVRLVSSADGLLRAAQIFDGLSSSFIQTPAFFRNDLKTISPRNLKNFNFDFIFRNFDNRQSLILNTEELASLFHLPGPTTIIPRINWLKSKEAAPPSNLPNQGVLLGESVFRGQVKPVYIQPEDRERHFYVIGQTGTGKSTLMVNMAIQDIKNGEGVAILDPHGDLINTILGLIPPERASDVILFDPTDIHHPLGLNMLEYDKDRPEDKTFIVNEMQSIFMKLFPESGEALGPVFQQYMRNALLLLMEDFYNEPATLVETPRVFTDAEWRKKKLNRIHNPAVFDFWEKEAAKAGGEASLQNITPYITSKFNNFIANDYMRPIIGQVRSAFKFREVLDQGKILLVNLAKGRLGDINAHLLGMIIVGKILMAALSRTDLAPEKRRRFYLYIDEFHNFTTDSISVILSEARKYKLGLVMAHQFIAQLSEKIRDSVFGNVGSIASFRVGIQDAEFLVKHFEPHFSVNDLINIDNFNVYLKILINGQPSSAFNARTLIFPPADQFSAVKIKELSRLSYTKTRETVEMDIYKRLRET